MESILTKIVRIVKEKRLFSTLAYVLLSKYKFLANNSLYHTMYNSRINKMKKTFKYPSELSIEITNICNARCLMCPHIHMKRKKQIMEEKTFQRILQELSPVSDKIKVIGVGFFGESLVDPSVVERIKAIKGQFKNARIEITTNAALLTPELLDNLWEAGLDRIKVSINATKKSSYEKIMGINYEKTMRNLEYLSDFRKTHKLFTIGSFVSFTENKDELATFHKKFNGYFGNLVSCEADTWRENVSVVSERKKSTVKQPYPCKMLWTSAIFSANGDMISCCRDYDGEVTFGNINKALFSEIWFGEKRRAFLQNHLNSKLCSTCENKYSNYFYWWSR